MLENGWTQRRWGTSERWSEVFLRMYKPKPGWQKWVMFQEEHSKERDSKFKGPEDDYTWHLQPAEKASTLEYSKGWCNDIFISCLFQQLESYLCNSDVALLLVIEVTSLCIWKTVISSHILFQLVPLCVVSPHRGPSTFLLWSGDVSVPSTAQSLEDIWLTTFNFT